MPAPEPPQRDVGRGDHVAVLASGERFHHLQRRGIAALADHVQEADLNAGFLGVEQEMGMELGNLLRFQLQQVEVDLIAVDSLHQFGQVRLTAQTEEGEIQGRITSKSRSP